MALVQHSDESETSVAFLSFMDCFPDLTPHNSCKKLLDNASYELKTEFNKLIRQDHSPFFLPISIAFCNSVNDKPVLRDSRSTDVFSDGVVWLFWLVGPLRAFKVSELELDGLDVPNRGLRLRKAEVRELSWSAE
ncbi:unnamed protein product [Schistosoma mattheei]|uniref:Uncharacterized protein n=1 Tax=Schistosoma mattheei TaxID=31246 RepID=A0A3P8D5M2_9TREM|nr:unnamed protein product [Schistosoma mattheei]